MITQTSQQKYKIPLTYLEYADGIYSLLTKMSNHYRLLIFEYLYIVDYLESTGI